MKKTIASMGLCICSVASAGTMGAVNTSPITYVTGEASYTWNQYKSVTINTQSSSSSNQGWGGRFGVGRSYFFNERFDFTSEIGGGYYGSTTVSIPRIGWSLRNNITGYDVLVGAIYKMPLLDLFGAIGFMAQNISLTTQNNLGLQIPGGVQSGIKTSKSNQATIMPEVKVGGIYNLTPNWGLTVAYLHVFGSSPKGYVESTETTTQVINNSYTNVNNPTLDSIMFGLKYSIV